MAREVPVESVGMVVGSEIGLEKGMVPRLDLPGPSKPIRVEPVEQPGRQPIEVPDEPGPEPDVSPEREPEPAEVPG